jgi:hypothetical protein
MGFPIFIVIQNNPPNYRNVLWFLKRHFYLGEEVDVCIFGLELF